MMDGWIHSDTKCLRSLHDVHTLCSGAGQGVEGGTDGWR
jgi:hypothetical protein